MIFRQIYDDRLAQYAYLIGCPQTGEALVVDPERDIDRYVALAEREGLEIAAVAETHIHADFLSGAREFAEQYDTKLYLSDEGNDDWKYEWVESDTYVQLLNDGDTFTIGNVEVQAVHTPGHTPEHLSFLITDRGSGADQPRGLITGDFIFVGDAGRPDLLETAAGREEDMEPSARRLFHSIERFQQLPDYMQVWPGHGAGSACGKGLGSIPDTTVGCERRFSPALKAAGEGEEQFVGYILADQPEPPLYFGRMKTLNREGVPLLEELPQPERLSADDLEQLGGRTDLAVVDTRLDRVAFMEGHLPGAFYVPFDKTFPTIAGSYLEPDQVVYLIIAEEDVEEAVRSLVRVGLDRIAGYCTPDTLSKYAAEGGARAATEIIDFSEVQRRRKHGDVHVLDVRGVSEYRKGHLPGSQQIAHIHLRDHVEEVPRERQVLVHCGVGKRSSSAAALLERSGFDVTLVNDSWSRWSAAHPDEVQKEAVFG